MIHFVRVTADGGPGKGDDFLRCNGAGEMLVFSAADFEDFQVKTSTLSALNETVR